MIYCILPMTSEGGARYSFTLGNTDNPYTTTITAKYNYTTQMWLIDMADINLNSILNGLALIPGYSLLHRFPEVQALIGNLVAIEKNTDDYKNPDSLGTTLLLLWYPIGTEVIIPI